MFVVNPLPNIWLLGLRFGAQFSLKSHCYILGGYNLTFFCYIRLRRKFEFLSLSFFLGTIPSHILIVIILGLKETQNSILGFSFFLNNFNLVHGWVGSPWVSR